MKRLGFVFDLLNTARTLTKIDYRRRWHRLLNLGTKYYADIEHCSRGAIEEWSKNNNWELVNEELDIPDYGKVCRLDAWRDKSPANIGELLGMKRQSCSSNGVDVIGGMVSWVHIGGEIAAIIWPILRNG